ncbi:MAG: polynucleotide adenylyltransferase PcnB [Verrucomicrobiota bacterium]|nr:polynucleotide adenylyltransferase PcnB [Verrucomicrobiota bacterium]
MTSELPKHYPGGEHTISVEAIDCDALRVIMKLRDAGFRAYLVGGGVRDLLLGVRPKDFDVSTSAKPEEVRKIFSNSLLIGRRFRLAHVRFGKKVIEVSTFRSGEIDSPELIVRDNRWGTEEEDVLRRDFTINGLFFDPQENLLIDYVEGYPDLQKKILRTIGDPSLRFKQDPVRMIRLIKFCARFQFVIDPPTLEALLACKEEILQSSSVRIFEELLRMLESGSSRLFLHLLQEYGFLAALLPEFSHFLATYGDALTFQLLEEVDRRVQAGEKAPARSLLVALLLFPLLDQYLRGKEKSDEKPMHLGQLENVIFYVIDCFFSPFFVLSRKMRAEVAFLLTAQYRFVPLSGERPRHFRFPKDELTPLALDLLALRGVCNPDLSSYVSLWHQALLNTKKV